MELPACCSRPKRLWTALPAAAGWVKRYHARNTTTAQPATFLICMVCSYAGTSVCQPSLAQSDCFTNPLTCTDTVPSYEPELPSTLPIMEEATSRSVGNRPSLLLA